jgi:hypothetical protein
MNEEVSNPHSNAVSQTVPSGDGHSYPGKTEMGKKKKS